MKPQSVKYMLHAQDMERAVAFYRDTLGFTLSSTSEYWSELTFGDAILGLHGGGTGADNATGLSIQYEDVQAAFNTAIKAGATLVQEPKQGEGEPIILSSIKDSEGNVIMLTQYVGN